METNEEYIASVAIATNEEYTATVAKEFPRFSIDLGLCNPRSMKLSRIQLCELLKKLEKALESYDYLAKSPLLKISMQAVNTDLSAFGDPEHLVGSVEVFTPFSVSKMATYQTVIYPSEIILSEIFIRSLNSIRKQSLVGESEVEEKLEDNSALIFVVDDNQVTIVSLTKMIKRLNSALTIRSFNDGSEIVKAYSNRDPLFFVHPQLIFMDMQMPVLNGMEASKEIRAQEQRFELEPTFIAALTASTEQQFDLSEFEKVGIDLVLRKPFTTSSIQEALQKRGLLLPVQLQENAMNSDYDMSDKNPTSLYEPSAEKDEIISGVWGLKNSALM